MIYIAAIVLSFALIQLTVALVNLIFIQPFKNVALEEEPVPTSREGIKGGLTKIQIPLSQKKKILNSEYADNDLVSVLIPARNEEKNIGNLLEDLTKHDYKHLEIIVLNDLSTDRTADIVTSCAEKDARINIVNSEGLPDGWLGKNYACHSLSKLSTGKYLLFLDADVRIEKGLIARTTSFMKKHNLAMMSIFPQQLMYTSAEKATVPMMNFILLTLLPLILVRKSRFSSLAAANGQFLLFDSNTYQKTLPHEKMKNNKVEDIEIARHFKSIGLKIACVSGKNEIKCRMYSGFNEAVNGFTKNIFNFFGNSTVLAFLFWAVTTLGFIPLFFLKEKLLLIIYLLIIILTRILVSIVSRQNVKDNLIFLIPQQIAMGLIIFRAFINRKKRQFEWKGRNIS